MLNRRTLIGAASAAALMLSGNFAFAQETYIPLISKGFQHQFWQAVKAWSRSGRLGAGCHHHL